MSACLDGHPEIVELLMNSSKTFGIDLNARDDYGETGFMKACLKGQTEIVNILINSSEPFGIDINARDDEGETGFMKACWKGQTEIVKLMMKSSKTFGGCETVMLMLENHKKYGINIKQETFIWETALGLVGEDCSNQYNVICSQAGLTVGQAEAGVEYLS